MFISERIRRIRSKPGKCVFFKSKNILTKMSPIECQHYGITCVYRHRCTKLKYLGIFKSGLFLEKSKPWKIDILTTRLWAVECGAVDTRLTSFLKSAELLSIWKFDTFLVFDDLDIWEFKLNIFRQRKYILPTCQESNIYCMFLKSCVSSSQFF